VNEVQPPPADRQRIELLNARDGEPTGLLLRDGRRLDVWNIAWGYDMGDDYAHATANCSAFVDGLSLDFFFTSEVQSVRDSRGAVLYRE